MLLNKFSQIINLPYKYKILIMISLDIFILFLSLYISISARLGSLFYTNDILYFILFIISPIICIPIFYKIGLYSNLIRYINFNFIIKIFIATLIYALIWSFFALIFKPEGFPRSVTIINFFISLTLFANLRVLAKTYIDYSNNIGPINKKNILIYGTNLLAISLYESARIISDVKILGFVDNQKDLQNRLIYNLKVYSSFDLLKLIKKNKIDEIIIAKELIDQNEKDNLYSISEEYNISIKIKSENYLNSLNNNEVNLDDFEKIDKNNIFKRNEILHSKDLLERNIKDKVIFISGAGGSIGSEICLQCLNLKPKKIILFEQNEYALFKIIQKLKKYNASDIEYKSYLGSINDISILEKIFEIEKPYTIFHTAAHKHVSIVENNIVNSFVNNVFGTYNLAKIAIKNQVSHFVNISTDKAVNPISIMGCTKRLSELIIQFLSNEKNYDNSFNHTKFSIVRFGNVIGSSGSVIPIFKKQIKDGGPVTVTHPDVSRYFMSVSEAAQLVMQSSSIGKTGEIFLLEMGKPVKIKEIAKKLIDDYYKKNPIRGVDKKIEIIYSGLTKNEKLTEDLFYNSSKLNTIHPKIYIDSSPNIISEDYFNDFMTIYKNSKNISEEQVLNFISKYIKTFRI